MSIDKETLQQYLKWANSDLYSDKPLPTYLQKALIRYAKHVEKRRNLLADRVTTIQLMQAVEDEGYTGEKRFEEIAKHQFSLTRSPTQSQIRLIKSWWEARKRDDVVHWTDEKYLNQKPGPKPGSKKGRKSKAG